MTKISLRVYNKEIEDMIDRGQTDEAIAHCKFILKQFPKLVDTYRLLGKAYLESRHYTEASDILRRLLSVIPDDFVANLGISIIKEDENNLDSAIWHMERAFEFQPSNPTIQNELQRLRSRRDGIEPPKIRLTRGALIRMYERGELYPQAIAEIKAALAEDPKRIDLLVILARVYFSANQKVEATETCVRLISKLPFCYEANRILAEILPSTSRAEDAEIYKQRLNALDPYSAFTSESSSNPILVPDNAVLVEKLDWQPTMPNEIQPNWAQTVGVTFEEEEALPSILDDFFRENTEKSESSADEEVLTARLESFPQNTESSEQTTPELSDASKENKVIPDWMQDAGWTVNTQTSGEPETSLEVESSEEDVEGGEISPAEIPDWLQALAPSSSEEPPSTQASQSIANTPEVHPTPDQKDNVSAKDENNVEVSSPQFFGETGSEAIELAPPASPLSEKDIANPETEEIMDNPPPFENFSQDDENLPDWLKDLAGDEKEQDTQGASPFPKDEEMNRENKTSSSELDEAMAWLESLAARQGADNETLTTPTELRKDTPPDWVTNAQAEAAQEISQTEPSPQLEAVDITAASSLEIEDKDTEISGLEIDTLESDGVKSSTSALEDDTLDWLQSLGAGETAEAGILTGETDSLTVNVSSWADESFSLKASETEPPDSTGDFDASFEAPLDTDQPAEELPEWLKNSEAQPQDREDETPAILPDWLKDLEIEEETEAKTSLIDDSIPESSWVSEEHESPASPRDQTESPVYDSELPDWLNGMDNQPAGSETETLIDINQLGEIAPVAVPDLPVQQETPESETSRPAETTFEASTSWEPSAPETPAMEPEVPALDSSLLDQARQMLDSGDLNAALEEYNRAIENKSSLESVIQDLQKALYRHPVDIGLWQTLGDALAGADRLQEALDAYTKAEELLK